MKKNCVPWGRVPINFLPLIRIMKLCILFLVLLNFSGIARSHAQVKRLTLSLENVELREVFKNLKQMTGLRFFYNEEILKQEGLRDVDIRDLELNKALDAILDGTKLTYSLLKDVVVIQSLDEKTGAQAVKRYRISGKVKDDRNNPLPGVTVALQLDSLKLGTSTDVNGDFHLDLPLETGKLVFSFIGYKTQTLNFKAGQEMVVKMKEDIAQLDEAIVVGYGTTTRREATGSVSVVKGDDFKGIPSSNLANLLQGRVAGMDVTNISGAPGSGGTAVTIRGFNSLSVEQGRRFSNPLWVVDGVPLNSFTSPVTGTNLLSDLNPDMIESVQILKDASSAAIYGSRAANGVIIVTTKKGSKNKSTSFSVNFSQTWSVLPELPTVTVGRLERNFRLSQIRNTHAAYWDERSGTYKYPQSYKEQYDHREGSFDGNWHPVVNGASDYGSALQDSLNSFYNQATNFFPAYYRMGKVTNANMQAYGGGEKFSYGLGLGYYKETGILKGTGYDRVDLNTSMNVNPAERFNVDVRLNASLAGRMRGVKMGSLSSSQDIETVPGNPYMMSSLQPGEGSAVWEQALDQYEGIKERNRSVRLRPNIRVAYEILKGLSFSASLSADYSIERRNYFEPARLSAFGYSNSVGETAVNLMMLNEDILTYTKSIREVHNFSAVAGFSYQYDQSEYNGGSAKNSPSDKIEYAPPGLPDLAQQGSFGFTETVAMKSYQSDMQEKKLISYFARLEYNFMKRYLVSLSYRRDGSSTFGADNKWGNFPSVAAGWTFSEENFMQGFGWLDFGKFRASWGRSGMHFYQNYLALGIMEVDNSSYLGNGVLTPVWSDGLFNPDLSWEKTDQYDFGLDLDLLDYRLGMTLDYYYRYTTDMLYPVPIPGNYNGYQQQWRNTAAISNEGLEFLVKYEIFRDKDVYWKISVNAAKNWNKFRKSYDGRDLAYSSEVGQNVIGKPLNGIMGYVTEGYYQNQNEVPLVDKADGSVGYQYAGGPASYFRAGDYKMVDVNGDGEIGIKDVVNLGSALPVVSGGIVNEVQWKGFDLNMLWSYQIGRHILNPTVIKALDPSNDYQAFVFDLPGTSFWQRAGDNTDYFANRYGGQGLQWVTAVDRYVQKVNWIKLKTLSVGYTIPKTITRQWGIQELRFFASGENLWTITNYKGIDPETVDLRTGIDSGVSYPLARRITLGLTLKF